MLASDAIAITAYLQKLHSKGQSTWTSGAKDGVGTAYYDLGLGESPSNVWYTLCHGVLTEVYYPTVDVANLQMMQFIVVDHFTRAVVDEQSGTVHQTELIDSDALVYRQANTSEKGHFSIRKTYITDPAQNSLYVEVTFQTLRDTIHDYDLYLYANPIVSNCASDDVLRMERCGANGCFLAHDDRAAIAISASRPFADAMVYDVCEGLLRDRMVAPGDAAFLAQLDLRDVSEGLKELSFTIVLGFGRTEDEATQAAEDTLNRPFVEVMKQYQACWQGYVDSLNEPPPWVSRRQYYAAAMVVKAHEDKLHPGAIVASLCIPWGDSIPATNCAIGGYHLVWARDLYHIATGLAAVGDTATAKRALAYLDEIQQKPDGSFPQNSWLNGDAYWNGLQLDEAAFPILLAYYLGEYERYESLVKPAADCILRHGPRTEQERWEENEGLSPSTLAAEIAALVVAANMASIHGDFASSKAYLATADKWVLFLDDWLAAKRGRLSAEPYYIRISEHGEHGEHGNPTEGDWIEIKNGGGWHPKSEIVDAGFLELVRLGVKAPDDRLIVSSLNVVDSVIKRDSPFGPVWYRYNHDGYGEHEDGSPYDGTGVGRLWPVLIGERGEYEVALSGKHEVLRSGDCAALADDGALCDNDALGADNALSELHLFPVPNNLYGPKNLLRAMGALANEGNLIPEQVWDSEAVKDLGLIPFEGTGAATPLAWAMAQYLRLVACIQAERVVEMPDVVERRYAKKSARRLLFETRNQAGAGHHQRTHMYPQSPVFTSGDFELQAFRVFADELNVYFEIELGNLDDPWNAPTGISKQLIDIYVDMDAAGGSGQRWTMGWGAQFCESAAWDKLIRVSGNWCGEARMYNADWSDAGPVLICPDYMRHTVVATVPITQLGSQPARGWGLMVLLGGERNGGVRGVAATPDEWTFGCALDVPHPPQFTDCILPDNMGREMLFHSAPEDGFIELPMVRM